MVAKQRAVRISSRLSPQGFVVLDGLRRGQHTGWTQMVTDEFAAEVAAGVMRNYPMAPAPKLIGLILALGDIDPPVVNSDALVSAMQVEIDNRGAAQPRPKGEQE